MGAERVRSSSTTRRAQFGRRGRQAEAARRGVAAGGGGVEPVVPPTAVEAVVRAGCGDPPAFGPTDARIRLLNLLAPLRELCIQGAPPARPARGSSWRAFSHSQADTARSAMFSFSVSALCCRACPPARLWQPRLAARARDARGRRGAYACGRSAPACACVAPACARRAQPAHMHLGV